jgi:hypothetical protein
MAAVYSLRINRSQRATAYRQDDFMRFLTIAPHHDAAYGKKGRAITAVIRPHGPREQQGAKATALAHRRIRAAKTLGLLKA